MHKYSVQLRISGQRLEPDAVTQAMNLVPNLTRMAGSRRSQTSAWTEALWSFDGGDSTSDKEWDSLADGLNYLLDRLEAKKHTINQLAQEFSVIWWCAHYQSSFDGGPTLSVELLKRLSDFGVPLYLDNYFSAESNE
jgi:hypothetical protein